METAAGSTKAPPQDIGTRSTNPRYLPRLFPPYTGERSRLVPQSQRWYPLSPISPHTPRRSLARADVQLDGVEFSSLPSGLHLVEQDVVYFTKDGLRGVCIFSRRPTSEHGQRGFRLSSLGILLARSPRPRPWRHVTALKALVHEIHSDPAAQGESSQDVWEPARRFFELRKASLSDLGGAGAWHRWSEELDFGIDDGGVDGYEHDTHASPTLHLPHLLRVLGPSSLTLYKHVLGRRRILIYTQPPVEAACFLCQVAADMCFEDQTTPTTAEGEARPDGAVPRLKSKHKEGINVLGSVTLHDIDMLERESHTGRGWIACTTDAVFLEKPQHYDLIIDLTSYAPERRATTARPGLQLTTKEPYARRPTYRLSTVRFTWSDVKLWTELDRILQLDADTNGVARASPSFSTWTDAWGVYDDVCLVCARLCSGFWRSSNGNNGNGNGGLRDQWSWAGSPRARARRERSGRRAQVRAHGDGIEGRPTSYRLRAAAAAHDDAGKYDSDSSSGDGDEDGAVLVRSRQARTTLALLQTFHAQTRFLLSRLATVLPSSSSSSSPSDAQQLTPRDLLVLALGPLSSLDARFVEWLAEEYAGGARVSVRRGWRDLLGGLVGVAVGGSGPALSSSSS
ncbi:hypothetical protein BJY52DRAFT_1213071 [Lactarius psammicola]|nr:hypothetical protein BJY52DRAFT_1213071 [Lactarius psammicola]